MGEAESVLLVVRGLDPVGTGRLVEIAAEGVAAAGHTVAVAVTTMGGSVPQRLESRGISVHRLGGRPVGDVAATLRLAGLVRRLRPAAIVGFGRSQIVRVAVASRLVARCRGMVWIGLPPVGAGQAGGLRRLNRVVAASTAVAEACRRAGVRESRLACLPPGVVADAGAGLPRAEVAGRLGLDPTRQWTLAVAPLEPQARLARLVWAIDQLGVVRKDLQHVLVGAGPLADQIRRRARTQELAERLFIRPDCDLLPDLLGQVSLVWQSGDVALGGAILDGMARGVSAVAVESDAARQLVVDGETGRVVPPLPESEFPRRAFGILEDEPLACRFGAAAATRATAAFPAEAFVAGLLAVLQSA